MQPSDDTRSAATSSEDIVRRLRWHAMDRSNGYTSLTAEAADEIERLRREIDSLRPHVEGIGYAG